MTKRDIDFRQDRVYTTTGLLIPPSPLYEVYEKSATPLEQLFSRSMIDNSDLGVLDFYKSNEIFTSLQANRLYLNYISEPTYDNFMEMVNFATDIFKGVTCREFFQDQVASLHISQMTLMLCKDIINGNIGNYIQYAGVSPGSRFVISNGVTVNKANETMKKLFSEVDRRYGSISWVQVLTPVVENEGAFVMMFKHFFVDYY